MIKYGTNEDANQQILDELTNTAYLAKRKHQILNQKDSRKKKKIFIC